LNVLNAPGPLPLQAKHLLLKALVSGGTKSSGRLNTICLTTVTLLFDDITTNGIIDRDREKDTYTDAKEHKG
jgi:hypothetical protein